MPVGNELALGTACGRRSAARATDSCISGMRCRAMRFDVVDRASSVSEWRAVWDRGVVRCHKKCSCGAPETKHTTMTSTAAELSDLLLGECEWHASSVTRSGVASHVDAAGVRAPTRAQVWCQRYRCRTRVSRRSTSSRSRPWCQARRDRNRSTSCRRRERPTTATRATVRRRCRRRSRAVSS